MPCWRSESARAAISAGVEMAARLERVGVDLIDGDRGCSSAPSSELGLESAFLASQQGFQAASEASLIHGR